MAVNIQKVVTETDSIERIYDLFKSLGYPKDKLLDPSYKRKVDEFEFAREEREKIKDIYTVFNYDGKLQIFFIEAKSLSIPFVRYVTRRFSDRYLRFLLILTTDYREYSFVFPEFERIEEGKHRLKITRLNFDRTQPYHTDLLTISNLALTGDEENYRSIWRRWKDAFSVEKVTDRFFEDYKNAFFELRKTFEKQHIPIKQSHELSQQVLNRLMFLYFISKKRWLNNDPKFIKWYWDRYREERRKGSAQNDSFYDKWLQVLFLQAFNNQYSHPHYLPKDVDKVLADAPYLNGGLFKRNDLDDLKFHISDSLFEKVFSFFEKYNFTIREELPLDVEVAVDPQMIGYVYESLSNVAEEIYERQDLGIFYTPTVEVDFICRRSMVEYLSNQLSSPVSLANLQGMDNAPQPPLKLRGGEGGVMTSSPRGAEGLGEGYLSREWIYRLLFDEDKKAVAEHISKLKLWYRLEEVLDNLAVVDPACGSGAFLVGMLHVLTELYRLIYSHIKREISEFNLKKKIIGNSLYGVDVMPWAVHSAELRLWLQLIIEEDIPYEQRKLFPLLPNLNMKLRVGDSLVQEVGGISLHVRDSKLSPALKRRLTSLKSEKEKYYNNDPTAKFKSVEALQQEELRIFCEILDDKIVSLQKKVQELEGERQKLQMNMFGEGAKEDKQKSLFEEQIKATRQEIEHLRETKRKIQLPEQKPFVWDIDFAEIFGDKGGFDIVIGNPPYVRQEKIAPPNKLKAEVTLEDKRGYKDKLLSSIQVHYPFIKKLDKKSDYYIYFYFHGLSLLNDKGTFCFITSNSWLDVGYGKDLQEFLLKYCHIKAIYDNEAKRSFEHADVNTIIALLGPPDVKKPTAWPALKETARFVMFKKPFEEAINTKNLLAIEKADSIHKTESYRIYPLKQETLLEEGWEKPEEDSPHPNPLPKGEGIINDVPLPEGDGITNDVPLQEGEKIINVASLVGDEGINSDSLSLRERAGVREDLALPKTPLPKELLKACRELRRNSTDAEQLLWNLLRNRQLKGAKFRRQHPIGNFILDFYCHEVKLAIELDGGGHAEDQQKRYDKQRTQALEAEGIRVLRFWNHEVLQKTEAVIETIWNALQQPPHPNPLPEGEGIINDEPLPKGEGIKSGNPLTEGEGIKSGNFLTRGEGIVSDNHPTREEVTKQEETLSKRLPLPVGEGRGEGVRKERKKLPASLLKEKFITGKYEGNKWGGKYLRAPDIFYTILEKGKDKLTAIQPNVGKVITVAWSRKGLNSEILIPKKGSVLSKYETLPVLKSPREIEKIVFGKNDTETLLLLVKGIKKELKHAKLLWVDIRGDRHLCHYNTHNLYFTHNFHGIVPIDDSASIVLCGILNSTLTAFFTEILGRKGLGGGAVRLLVEDLRRAGIVVAPSLLQKKQRNKIEELINAELGKRRINSIFTELGINPSLPIREQKPNPLPDRKALDDIVFDILGLTEAERNEVYWAVCELVKNRLEKARSV